MMKKTYKIASVLLVIALVLVGCAPSQTSSDSEGKLLVYTTIYPLYEFASQIGGSDTEVRLMVPAGSEPHDYEPSAKAVGAIENADIFIYNGSGMEPWVDSLLGSVSNDDLLIINATSTMDLLSIVENEDDHEDGEEESDHHDGDTDPHVWLDPLRAVQMAEAIYDGMAAMDPEGAQVFKENYDELVDALKELDAAYEKALMNPSNANIVVGHAAFGYLTQRYHLNQIAIAGISPLEEPSAAQLGKIVDVVNELKINTIFYDALTSGKLSNVIATETGVAMVPLHPLGSVTQQDLDAGKTYFTIMYDNLEALKTAVQ